MSVQYPSLDDYYNQSAPKSPGFTSSLGPSAAPGTPFPTAPGTGSTGTTPTTGGTPAEGSVDPQTGLTYKTRKDGTFGLVGPGTGYQLDGTPYPAYGTAADGTSPGQLASYGSGSLASLGSYSSGSPYPAFNSTFHFPGVTDAPAFNAPKFAYEDFKAPGPFVKPTAADAAAEPGYQFRLGQGTQTLENSAAARGVLRSGGTLKGLEEYGQNFASNEYQNVYNRAASEYDRMFGNKLDVYKTNYGVGRDVFDRTYQGARDEYAPGFATWNARTNAEQNQALAMFKREWDSYALSAGLDSRERDRQLQVTLTQMGIDAEQVLAILGLRG